jgi:putative ABC transport system permease protein
MMLLKIAIRNIFRHRVRSTITISTIVFGCVALIFVGGFFEDLFWRLRESYIRAQTGHIQIYRHGFNQHGKIDPYNYLIENPDEIKALVKTLPEVRIATSRLQFSGLISTGETTISFVGQGIEPENERHVTMEETADMRSFSNTADAGLPVTASGESLIKDDVKAIVMGQGLAETMKAKPGSTITLLTNTIRGSTNAMDVNVKGIFFTSIKDFDDIFIRLPLVTAQKLLGTGGVQVMVLRLYKTEDTAKVYQQLKTLFAQKNLDLEIKRWEELADFYNKTVSLFDKFYWVMRIVIGTVVILGIFNTLNMSVMERISEIGTMMALGVRRRVVMKLFFLEGLLLGAIGGVIGVIAGTAIVGVVSWIGIWMPPPPGATIAWLSTPRVVPAVLCSTFAIAVIVGAISALYPAYKASRLQITAALRYR